MADPSLHSDESEHSPSRGSRIRLIVGLLFAVTAFYLVVNSMTEGGAYFYTVDEVADRPVDDRLIRIKGTVVAGTYQRDEQTNEHSFTLTEQEKTMAITYKGALPDVFGEGTEVVATGKRDAQGRLIATEVTAKCPSKYEGDGISDQARERLNQQRPSGA